MLAADGAELAALCLASSSASGTMTIGKKTVPTAGTDLQIGLLGDGNDYTSVSPEGAGIRAEPVVVPGGLLNLMCPSDIPVLTTLCEKAADSRLNRVVATVEPAGTPTDFSLTAGLSVGQPIITLPVKIRLDNILLGGNCYIGSDEDPILLRPRNTAQPTLELVRYAPDGTDQVDGVMSNIVLSGADQADDSFSVPKANGSDSSARSTGPSTHSSACPHPRGPTASSSIPPPPSPVVSTTPPPTRPTRDVCCPTTGTPPRADVASGHPAMFGGMAGGEQHRGDLVFRQSQHGAERRVVETGDRTSGQAQSRVHQVQVLHGHARVHVQGPVMPQRVRAERHVETCRDGHGSGRVPREPSWRYTCSSSGPGSVSVSCTSSWDTGS